MSGLINSVRLGLIGELISTMKKIIGTKVKRYVAGSLAFVTAMIFSLPGNMQAQSTAQTITASDIDDVTYGEVSYTHLTLPTKA